METPTKTVPYYLHERAWDLMPHALDPPETPAAADPFAAAGPFERVLVTRRREAYLGGTCVLPG